MTQNLLGLIASALPRLENVNSDRAPALCLFAFENETLEVVLRSAIRLLFN